MAASSQPFQLATHDFNIYSFQGIGLLLQPVIGAATHVLRSLGERLCEVRRSAETDAQPLQLGQGAPPSPRTLALVIEPQALPASEAGAEVQDGRAPAT